MNVEIVTAFTVWSDWTDGRYMVARVERRPITDDAGETVGFEYRTRTSHFDPYREDVSDWLSEGTAFARFAGAHDAARDARTFHVADATGDDLVARTA